MSGDTNSTEVGTRLLTMLQLQNAINLKINAAWVQAGNPWHRAIWTECAEMMDHVGWKWWKKNQPNMEQIHLELVDIFHFGLSDLIVANGTIDAAKNATHFTYELIEKSQGSAISEPDRVLSLIENLTSTTLIKKSFSIDSFAELCISVGLVGDQLYRKYVGKNVLNAFRQDNGYKDGSYIKIWNGREDNEWLSEIAASMKTSSEDYPALLYQKLKTVYNNQHNHFETK